MAVHGNTDSADWSVKLVTGKVLLDGKKKPLTGLSYKDAYHAAQSHINRTGEFASAVRG